jgi:hypothetical protein
MPGWSLALPRRSWALVPIRSTATFGRCELPRRFRHTNAGLQLYRQ